MSTYTSKAFLRTAAVVAAVLVCGAWTKVDSKPIDASTYAITAVCIEENTEVKIADLTSLIHEGFERHGIATETYDKLPDSCDFYVKYTATRRWDFVAFLSDARIAVYHRGKLIGFAERVGREAYSAAAGPALTNGPPRSPRSTRLWTVYWKAFPNRVSATSGACDTINGQT